MYNIIITDTETGEVKINTTCKLICGTLLVDEHTTTNMSAVDGCTPIDVAMSLAHCEKTIEEMKKLPGVSDVYPLVKAIMAMDEKISE